MKLDRPQLLIVFPPSSGARSGVKGIYYPLGIGYIASALRKQYDVVIHDFDYDFCFGHFSNSLHIENVLRSYNYDLLLIGGVFPKYKYLKEIIVRSREISKAKIIVGGSYVSSYIKVLANYLYADYYVMGEGENIILNLLDCISSDGHINDVDGIAYHDGNNICLNKPAEPLSNLDDISFPARDLSNFHCYKRRFSLGNPLLYTAYVITSRGCPLNCIFCNPAFGRKVRVRSPENIMEEIFLLQKDYNCNFIFFHDEVLLGGKRKHVESFCEYVLSKRKTKFFWAGTTNPRMLDSKILRLMKEAGCIKISLGVESGSEMILKEMRKRNNLEQTKEIVSSCEKLGIEYDFSLLTNTFSETEETLNQTKDYLKYFNTFFLREPPSINFITPIPGTDIYNEAKKKNLIQNDDLQNLLELDESSRYELKWNLTNLDTNHFISLVNEINRELAEHYFLKHPLQYLIYRYSNLTHFRLKETILSLSINNIRPFMEGMLWAISKGDEEKLLGMLYKKIVYNT